MVKQKNNGDIASRDDIMSYHRAPKPGLIDVPGFDKKIRVEPLSDKAIYEIREMAGNAPDSYNAMIVAAVCTDLELSDAHELQKNGMRFVVLFQAVMQYLGVIGDEAVKK